MRFVTAILGVGASLPEKSMLFLGESPLRTGARSCSSAAGSLTQRIIYPSREKSPARINDYSVTLTVLGLNSGARCRLNGSHNIRASVAQAGEHEVVLLA